MRYLFVYEQANIIYLGMEYMLVSHQIDILLILQLEVLIQPKEHNH